MMRDRRARVGTFFIVAVYGILGAHGKCLCLEAVASSTSDSSTVDEETADASDCCLGLRAKMGAFIASVSSCIFGARSDDSSPEEVASSTSKSSPVESAQAVAPSHDCRELVTDGLSPAALANSSGNFSPVHVADTTGAPSGLSPAAVASSSSNLSPAPVAETAAPSDEHLELVTEEQRRYLQELLDTSMSMAPSVATRDRSGPAPSRLEIVKAYKVTNKPLLDTYNARKEEILAAPKKSSEVPDSYVQKEQEVQRKFLFRNEKLHRPAMDSGSKPEQSLFSAEFDHLSQAVDEVLLWHGTAPTTAKVIAKEGFKLGNHVNGDLYGPGVYLAEYALKSDEYARATEGVRSMLLCRAALGNVDYCAATDWGEIRSKYEGGPAEGFHSILGDRETAVNTFREFIIPNESQVVPEYVLEYHRVFDHSHASFWDEIMRAIHSTVVWGHATSRWSDALGGLTKSENKALTTAAGQRLREMLKAVSEHDEKPPTADEMYGKRKLVGTLIGIGAWYELSQSEQESLLMNLASVGLEESQRNAAELMSAVEIGDTVNVKKLLRQDLASVFNTHLDSAAARGTVVFLAASVAALQGQFSPLPAEPELVKILGEDLHVSGNTNSDLHYQTLLEIAVKENLWSVVLYLLELLSPADARERLCRKSSYPMYTETSSADYAILHVAASRLQAQEDGIFDMFLRMVLSGARNSEERINVLSHTHTKTAQGKTVLQVAAGHGATANMQAIFTSLGVGDKNANCDSVFPHETEHTGISAFLSSRSQEGATALHDAATQGNPDAVKLILAQATHPDFITMQNTEGKSALHCAAEAGQSEAVEALLADGTFSKQLISMKDSHGWTALHLAAGKGDAVLVEIILTRWPDSSLADLLAMTTEHERSLLLEIDEYRNRRFPSGETALHCAARGGNPDVVKLILAKTADPNFIATQSNEGKSALHCAAEEGQSEAAEALLADGTFSKQLMSMKDSHGWTALHLAAGERTR